MTIEGRPGSEPAMGTAPGGAAPGGATLAKRRLPAIVSPGQLKPSMVVMLGLGVVLLAAQIANMASSYWLSNSIGIRPRSLVGLWGILDAPLLHWSWSHLAANVVPFLLFGFLIMLRGTSQFVATTVLIWLISGFGVWLTAPSGSVTVGASTLVFGWLTFLLLRGLFGRRWTQLALGVVLFALWGGIFWGLLPGTANISWQGHLFGAIGGALAAFLVGRADRASVARTA